MGMSRYLRELLNDGEFRKVAAELGACARGVFKQQREAGMCFVTFVDSAPGESNSPRRR